MRICHISTVHKTFDVRIFHKQCVSQASLGNEVFLIVQGNDQTTNGVNIIGLPKPINRRARMLKLTKIAYKKAMELNADIYQVHDPELLPIARKIKAQGRHVIYDSHEIYGIQVAEKSYFPNWVKPIVRKIYLLIETSVIKKLDGVLVPCTVDGKNVFENRANHTLLVPNYPKLSELSDSINYQSKDRAVCFLGKISKSHGFTEVMKACYLAGVKLIAAGDTNQAYFDEIKSMKEFKCVDYRGYVDRKEINNILSQSRIGIATYYLEGQYALPLDNVVTKAYEYMCAGLPVIYTRRPFTEWFFENEYNCGVCVDAKNHLEIREAIESLMINEDLSMRLGQNGRSAIMNKMNWERVASELNCFYETIIKYR